MSNSPDSVYEILSKINMQQFIKAKQKQRFIPWYSAFDVVQQNFPNMIYEVLENDFGLPFFDSPYGIFVKTKVTIQDRTLPMILPVLDGANKAMKSERYSYKVKEYKNSKFTGNYTDKYVEPATAFDINTSIMRCLTKNIASFGLGLYVYANEQMPKLIAIDSEQLTALAKLSTEKKVNLEVLNKAFGVNKTSELYSINFENALMFIEENAS